MTRMTGPDCAIMCNLINTNTHTWEDQCEWHRMTRMTGPDCAVMCNLINTHTHTLVAFDQRFSQQVSLIPPWEDQREWHRMTRMTRPDYALMCNLINTHTHTHIHTHLDPPLGGAMRVAKND